MFISWFATIHQEKPSENKKAEHENAVMTFSHSAGFVLYSGAVAQHML
jgi:hypothetical protein